MNEISHCTYRSIESAYNSKYVKIVSTKGYTTGAVGGDDDKWVVVEKIHGSNFSVIISEEGKTIHYAKRNSMITPEDKFFNYKQTMAEINDNIVKLYFLIVKYVRDTLQNNNDNNNNNVNDKNERNIEVGDVIVRIYGEYFGGSYPHPDVPAVPNQKHVQKGVYYSPTQMFIIFDAMVHNWGWIPHLKLVEMCDEASLFSSKPLAVLSFREALEYEVLFHTTIPKLLGLPEIQGNYCEGVVIKHHNNFSCNGRVLLKKKNKEFDEATGVVKLVKTTQKKTETPKISIVFIVEVNGVEKEESIKVDAGSDRYQTCVSEFARYFNENRVNSVISKLGEVKSSQINKIRGLLAQDAWTDYLKDQNNLEENDEKNSLLLSDEEKKKLKATASNFAVPHVNAYFLNANKNNNNNS